MNLLDQARLLLYLLIYIYLQELFDCFLITN